MHRPHLQTSANIAAANAALITCTATDDWIHDNTVAFSQKIHPTANVNNLAGNLMTNHPRIGGYRRSAMINMHIRSADASSLDFDQHLIYTFNHRNGPFLYFQLIGSQHTNGLHCLHIDASSLMMCFFIWHIL